MYRIKIEKSFDAAHFLAGYIGKCSNIHGHRWKVIVEIKANRLNDKDQLRGMIVDFGELKEDLAKIVDKFDHSLIYESGTLREETIAALKCEKFLLNEVEFRPTAENFSKYFYDEMKKKYDIFQVAVYETPNNCAVYGKEVIEELDVY